MKENYKLKRTFSTDETENDSYIHILRHGALDWPLAMAMDAAGNLFVGNYTGGSDNVLVFTPDGKLSRFLGGPQIHIPACLLFNPDGDLVIVEHGQGQILIVNPLTGERKLEFGKQLHEPTWITMDHDGNYVVSDSGHDQIQFYTPQGDWIKTLGQSGSEPGELQFPVGCAVDTEGNFVISDRRNNRIQIFSPTFELIRVFAHEGYEGLSGAWGLVIDKNDCIVIADQEHSTIKMFSKDGLLIQQLGWESTAAPFFEPGSVFLNQDGVLYVSDSGRNQIKIFE